MTDEVTVTFELTLKPEAAEGFSRMDREALEATRSFPGFLEVRIVRHKDAPCRFLFIERWVSEEAYRKYIAFRTERGEFQPLLAMATNTEINIWPQTIAWALKDVEHP